MIKKITIANPDFLLTLYTQAAHLTAETREALLQNNLPEAQAILHSRRKLLKSIQRNISAAPEWGHLPEIDQAALAYILEDRKLAETIEVCCI